MIGPHKKDAVPKFSEYKAQFQPWNKVTKSMVAAMPEREYTPREKTKLKRSKSAEGKCFLIISEFSVTRKWNFSSLISAVFVT